ncbi:protein phosphatase 2C domain-containing protein [Arachidicoccus terrestris]|uniref:protein phosphatase 2C domain-containing protein n=1 Tax=Arachidicoccus terrestris TaxID=2875539 RepID=UPI001CC7EF64|nr:protein phosphatase 2C domain-containing protein [Arachidicoccus terrestris]UAY55685.1 protein phosphatase 2C domain-containing protein [Arachidicoccus terrestris]
MLKYTYRVQSVQKAGNHPAENEDAYLTPASHKYDQSDNILRFALADGATEGSFSKEWAEIVVQGFETLAFGPFSLTATVASMAEDWRQAVHHKTLPWYAAEKLSAGAFATFVGLGIDVQNGMFQAIGIGDTVLFNIRKDQLISSFPVTDPTEFSNMPSLISTKPEYTAQPPGGGSYLSGDIQPGDILLLATDALAHFILMETHKNGKSKVWKHLQKILYTRDDAAFKTWVEARRRKNQMKNDDTTLIMINF